MRPTRVVYEDAFPEPKTSSILEHVRGLYPDVEAIQLYLWSLGPPLEPLVEDYVKGRVDLGEVDERLYGTGGHCYLGYVFEGRKVGRWTTWYENGHKTSVKHYRHGVEHGWSAEWAPDGRMHRLGELRDGVEEGWWSTFEPDGTVTEGRREDELRAGVWTKRSRAGVVWALDYSKLIHRRWMEEKLLFKQLLRARVVVEEWFGFEPLTFELTPHHATALFGAPPELERPNPQAELLLDCDTSVYLGREGFERLLGWLLMLEGTYPSPESMPFEVEVVDLEEMFDSLSMLYEALEQGHVGHCCAMPVFSDDGIDDPSVLSWDASSVIIVENDETVAMYDREELDLLDVAEHYHGRTPG